METIDELKSNMLLIIPVGTIETNTFVWQCIRHEECDCRLQSAVGAKCLFQIYSWLNSTVGSCRSGLTCQLYNIGNSHEGNPIYVFKVLIACGVHITSE
jgi:hypothetical protein